MQKEEFDFAIFGSEIDAAILAVELAQTHNARILLIRDQVNDYALHMHQHFSMGAISDIATLEMLQMASERWHGLFQGRDGALCFERQNIRLRVSTPRHGAMLHYVENAMLDAQMQCERKADRQGFEYLSVRDVIAPKRKETLEFLASLIAPEQLVICDRSDFDQITHLKNGQLALKRDGQRFGAAQTVFLDDDLILTNKSKRLREHLISRDLNGFVFEQLSHPTPSTIMLDTNGVMHPCGENGAQLTSLQHQEAAMQTFNLSGNAQLSASATKKSVYTKDGAPMLGFENREKSWTTVSDKVTAPFYAFSIAQEIAGGQVQSPYWQQRGFEKRRCAEISAIALSYTGEARAVA
jgi:hypothetical protein